MDASDLFEKAMKSIERDYTSFNFFAERDIVWTIQKIMKEIINDNDLPYRVFHDYPIIRPQGKRATCADLAILDEQLTEPVEVAIELKYEPDHERGKKGTGDIWHSKFKPTVVFWRVNKPSLTSVLRDISRIHEYVETKRAKVAYAILIDEGSYFRGRHPHLPDWRDWKPRGVQSSKISALWSRVQNPDKNP